MLEGKASIECGQDPKGKNMATIRRNDVEDGADEELDATGLLCPLPVLKTRKRLAGAPSGRVFLVRATDPASIIDFPYFCSESGHELLGQSTEGELFLFRIRCK